MNEPARPDGRRADEIRPVQIQRGFLRAPVGAVLISMGETRVLCTACFEEGVPEWMAGKGVGRLTAEYDMLPASTGQRRPRKSGGKIDGRTQEIQRLIGRALRCGGITCSGRVVALGMRVVKDNNNQDSGDHKRKDGIRRP